MRKLGLIIGILVALSAAAAANALTIKATPPIALYGEPFSWNVAGLQPGERVTVKASSTDARGIVWESSAVFAADAAGSVDLARHAPVSGGYAEADIFGLLWSLKPGIDASAKPISYRENWTAGWTIDLEASNSAGAKAAAQFRCVLQKPDEALIRIPLEKDGLRGFLYCPAGGGPYPGIILLGGSEGGLSESRARAYASSGFAALTLAYFGYPGLPAELVEVPLECVEQAAAWMKARPEVKADRLGLLGGSKGAELALLAASRTDDFRAVAVLTPAAHSWEGHTMRFFSPDYQPVASWSEGGKPLPFVSFKVSPEDKAKEMRGELESFVFFFKDALAQADPAAVERAAIPVERIRAPILLVSGTDDQIWPSGEFSDAIVARLKKAGFPYEVKHVILEKGGHNAVIPFLITANRGLLIDGDPSGGAPAADARGGYRAWAETLDFLRRHLT